MLVNQMVFAEIKNYIDFLLAMTEKEIKARYKRAIFGFMWVVINPLMQMVIIGFIFSYFIKIENYYLFLFAGLLPWEFFSLSLSKATPSIVYERTLLKKAKFPREVIPISIVLSNFFHFIFSLALLIVILLIGGNFILSKVGFLLLAMVWLLFFTIGLSLLTSSLQVKYRDINFFIKAVLILWFYATPVIYPTWLVPDGINKLFSLNPLTTIVEMFHISLVGEGVLVREVVVFNILISFFIVVVGCKVFYKQYKYFNDWL